MSTSVTTSEISQSITILAPVPQLDMRQQEYRLSLEDSSFF